MNWNGKYVSIGNIIAKAYRDLGMSDQINFNDAVEWAGEAMELIGSPFHLIDKTVSIEVNNFRAKIPIDTHYIVTIAGAELEEQSEECDAEDLNYIPMRYSTDAFHHWRCEGSNDHKCNSDLTYKINDDYVFPNFETGRILMAYRGMPVDENCFPKIPDDIKFREAVTAHIKWKIAFIKWSQGKMRGDVYQKLEQDRDWYIGAAQTRSNMPSVDMAESIKNNWIRLIPKINQHADGFKQAGHREERYTHNSTGSGASSSSDKDSDNTYFNITSN